MYGAPKGPVSATWQLLLSNSILVVPERSSEVMGGWKGAIPYRLYWCCVSAAVAVNWQLWWLKCSFRSVPVGAGNLL